MADSLLTELENYDGEIPAELLEELDREIARNAEANRIAKRKRNKPEKPKKGLHFHIIFMHLNH